MFWTNTGWHMRKSLWKTFNLWGCDVSVDFNGDQATGSRDLKFILLECLHGEGLSSWSYRSFSDPFLWMKTLAEMVQKRGKSFPVSVSCGCRRCPAPERQVLSPDSNGRSEREHRLWFFFLPRSHQSQWWWECKSTTSITLNSTCAVSVRM